MNNILIKTIKGLRNFNLSSIIYRNSFNYYNSNNNSLILQSRKFTNNIDNSNNINNHAEEESKFHDNSNYKYLWLIGDVTVGLIFGYCTYSLYNFITIMPEDGLNAISIASKNPRVCELLGENISSSYMWKGTVNDHLKDLLIPISGSKGSGFLHLKAMKKDNEKWEWILFLVEFNEELIDLFEYRK